MMPKLDGLEACRQIKTNPRTAHVPVIMLSARTQSSDEDAGFAAGARAYIRSCCSMRWELGAPHSEICEIPA